MFGGLIGFNLFRADKGYVPIDFTAFWAAGRLATEGEDPYNPAIVWATQQATGLQSEVAVMMWNPPWTLALTVPFRCASVHPGLRDVGTHPNRVSGSGAGLLLAVYGL